jgi:hypothetical protein
MHGEVTHVATLNRARFTNLGQLTAFIRSNIGRRPRVEARSAAGDEGDLE